MLTLIKNRIQLVAIAAIIALLIGCTFITDRIIALIIRPYLREYYDAHFVKKTAAITNEEIYYFLVALQGYHIIVYHFFVLVAVLLVFFHRKFKSFKRELLLAYIVIAVADMIWVAIYVQIIKPR